MPMASQRFQHRKKLHTAIYFLNVRGLLNKGKTIQWVLHHCLYSLKHILAWFLRSLQQPQKQSIVHQALILHRPLQHIVHFLCSGVPLEVTPIQLFNNNILLFHIHYRCRSGRRQRHYKILLIWRSNNLRRTQKFLFHTALRLRGIIYKEQHWPISKRLMNHCKRIRFQLSSQKLPVFVNQSTWIFSPPGCATFNASISPNRTHWSTTGSLHISSWHLDSYIHSPSTSSFIVQGWLFSTGECTHCHLQQSKLGAAAENNLVQGCP